MMTFLRIVNNEPIAWWIATDPHDARRQFESAGDMDLAQEMYRLEFTPPPGKYRLGDFWMLVS